MERAGTRVRPWMGLAAVLLAGAASSAPISRPGWVWTESDLVANPPVLAEAEVTGGRRASIRATTAQSIRWALDPGRPRGPWGGEYLPLRDLTIISDRVLWNLGPVGSDALGFRLSSLFWHLLACAAAWGLVRRWTGSDMAACIAAALFAVHPVHAESVLLPANRKDPLFAALVLAALILVDRKRGRAAVCGTLAYAGALSSKLAALGAIPWMLLERLSGQRRPGAAAVAACVALALAAGLVGLRIGRSERVVLEKSPWGTPPAAAAAFLGSAGDGILALAWPQNLHPYHPANLHALGSGAFPLRAPWLVGIGVLALLPLAFRLVRTFRPGPAPEGPLRSFGGWFWCWLIPVSPIVAIGILRADRYLYLPALSAGLILAWAVSRAGPRRAAVPAVIALLALLVSSRALQPAFADNPSFWRAVLRKSPNHFDALVTRARLLTDAGRPERSLETLRRAEALLCEASPEADADFLGPRAFHLLAARKRARLEMGDPAGATRAVEEGIARHGRWLKPGHLEILRAIVRSESDPGRRLPPRSP